MSAENLNRVTSLFVRGGPSDGNKVLVDGVPAEDVGGGFYWGTVSSTGLSSVELYRNPNSALYTPNSRSNQVRPDKCAPNANASASNPMHMPMAPNST